MVFYLVDNSITKTVLELIFKILHPKKNQKCTGKAADEIFLKNKHFPIRLS